MELILKNAVSNKQETSCILFHARVFVRWNSLSRPRDFRVTVRNMQLVSGMRTAHTCIVFAVRYELNLYICPELIYHNCTVIYRPALSSERALQTYKSVNV
jgi:hypothetical protein